MTTKTDVNVMSAEELSALLDKMDEEVSAGFVTHNMQ
jgi:hypothetical protein